MIFSVSVSESPDVQFSQTLSDSCRIKGESERQHRRISLSLPLLSSRPLSVKSVIGGSITRSKPVSNSVFDNLWGVSSHGCVVPGKLVSTRVSTAPGSLQRSRSDIDVNAASSAKSRLTTVPASSPFSSAATLPPGSYASLGNPPFSTSEC